MFKLTLSIVREIDLIWDFCENLNTFVGDVCDGVFVEQLQHRLRIQFFFRFRFEYCQHSLGLIEVNLLVLSMM